jgi:phospholipase A-2-activating protein
MRRLADIVVIDLARCLAALSPSFAATPSLATDFLTSANWGQDPSPAETKARETNTLLALRGISNLFNTKPGRASLVRDAKAVLAGMGQGRWESGAGGGKWKVAAATVALK